MAQGILLDSSTVLDVTVENDYYQVYYGFHRFANFHKDDAAAKRITVVQLTIMGVTKTLLSRTFDVNPSSIYFWINTFEQNGMAALASLEKGPDSKLTVAIKDYIYALYQKLKGMFKFRDIIIEEVKMLYGVDISREAIRRVVIERKGTETTVSNEDEKAGCVEIKPKAETKPVIVKHGGALLTLVLQAKYGVEKLLCQGVSERKGQYGFKECVFSLLMLIGARLLTVEENLKHYDGQIMGGLIGRRRLPSVKTVRRVIAEGCEQIEQNVEQMKIEYARRCLEMWKYQGAFYLDGHFMPYSGGEPILYGYNSQRRLAEKGRSAYVVNTTEGRPIYEVLSDGFDDFKENIEKIVDLLREELGVERPRVIFDRGGFSLESLERIEKKADFICWYKGKASIPDGKWKTVKVPHESNTYGKPEYVKQEYKQQVIAKGDEEGREYRRMIFIKKGEKVSPAITNIKQATGKELVLELTRRWGAQENVFKELVIDGYDKIHSYRKEEYDEQYFDQEGIDESRMMENPERRKLVERKRELEKKQNVTLGKNAKREKESGKPIKLTGQQQERLDGIEKSVEEINTRLMYLPEQVLRLDYVNEKGMTRLSNGKKKYFDLLNLIAYNLRQDIVEIIGPVYRNARDVNQMVLKILRLMTTIEYEGVDTNVVFTEKLKGKEKEALSKICEYVSSIGHETALFPGKLSFGVK